MSYTDDPVRDAENYYSKEDCRPIIGTCEFCEEMIHGSTDGEYGDEYIEIHDTLIHWDCWGNSGNSLRRIS